MNKNIFLDENTYKKAKKLADDKYKTHGAYKSMFIVRKYKELGGRFNELYKDEKLTQWLKEKWIDIGNSDYPVYRPTKRINKNTPLTVNEIDKKQLKEQIKLKQKIKNTENLPTFKKK